MRHYQPVNPRRARRGAATLLELQALMVITAVISVPILRLYLDLGPEFARVQVQAQLQMELDKAIWRSTRLLREARTIEELSRDVLRLTMPSGQVHRLYLQDGTLWEQMGDRSPIALANHVAQLEFITWMTLGGQRMTSSDRTQITEVEVKLTLSNGGFTRTGSLLVHMRNRERQA